jgi:hypothetical protein
MEHRYNFDIHFSINVTVILDTGMMTSAMFVTTVKNISNMSTDVSNARCCYFR